MLEGTFGKRPIAVAISGGGARTAILGFEFLHLLRSQNTDPAVLAGNSGGAWGIALFKMHNSSVDILALMCDHLDEMMHINIVQSIILTLIRLSHGTPETAETFAYILPLLQHIVFDWRKMVRGLLFGSDDPPSWETMESQNSTVAFPLTMLADSHARRFDIS